MKKYFAIVYYYIPPDHCESEFYCRQQKQTIIRFSLSNNRVFFFLIHAVDYFIYYYYGQSCDVEESIMMGFILSLLFFLQSIDNFIP